MGYKIERLQQVIKLKVSQLIMRDLQDPRMGIVTITYVKLARDLSTCIVGYSVLGGPSEKSKCAHALEDARGWIQREVASILRTRRAPQLTFRFDESIEGSVRVAEILRRELGPEAEAGGADPSRGDETEPDADGGVPDDED